MLQFVKTKKHFTENKTQKYMSGIANPAWVGTTAAGTALCSRQTRQRIVRILEISEAPYNEERQEIAREPSAAAAVSLVPRFA